MEVRSSRSDSGRRRSFGSTKVSWIVGLGHQIVNYKCMEEERTLGVKGSTQSSRTLTPEPTVKEGKDLLTDVHRGKGS